MLHSTCTAFQAKEKKRERKKKGLLATANLCMLCASTQAAAEQAAAQAERLLGREESAATGSCALAEKMPAAGGANPAP
jgi:hypothetical protein